MKRKRYTAKKRYRKSNRKVRRKYSKKWWRNYRAKQRKKQRLAARKRSNRLRSLRAQKKRTARKSVKRSARRATIASSKPRNVAQQPMVPVANGNVAVDVVGASVGKTVSKGRRTQVGGVSTVNLRRMIIEQMIRENGWVENDYHDVVDGKAVYVVVAKAPGKEWRDGSDALTTSLSLTEESIRFRLAPPRRAERKRKRIRHE